jgi:hypothetical protein
MVKKNENAVLLKTGNRKIKQVIVWGIGIIGSREDI